MASTKLVFIGAALSIGEISQIVYALNRKGASYEILGALDDNSALHGQESQGVRVIGGLEMAASMNDVKFLHAIGSHKTRMKRLEIVDRTGLSPDRFETLIHPSANVYPDVTIGNGCIIHAGVTVAQRAVLSDFTILTFNAVVGPSAILGAGAMVASLAFVGSRAKIGPCSFVGASSAIAEDVVIGPGAMVGMSTAVYRPVSAGMFVLGNPARNAYPSAVPEQLTRGWSY